MNYKKSKIAPVIIIGMHRSGTTMITQFLEQLGLFVGEEKDVNHESMFFFDLNKWIFEVGISKVDYPHNMKLMNPNAKQEVVNVIDYHLSGPRKKKFLGKHRFKDIRDIDFKWGWKEPRNSFTLEHYKELFPNCKVIHIYRNPIDSANSYLKRDLSRRNKFTLTWKKKLKRKMLISDKYHQNFRLKGLPDGYALWEEYVAQSFSYEEAFGERMLTLRYEDFLDEPKKYLTEMASFCDLEFTPAQIEKVIANVDSSRKYAFLKDDESMAFYEQIKNDAWMQRLHYDNLTSK